MTRLTWIVAALAAGTAAPALAQAAADSTGIRQAALDYIEGWYEGNAERNPGVRRRPNEARIHREVGPLDEPSLVQDHDVMIGG